MLSMTPALTDPDLGFTAFSVLRTSYRRQNGSSVPSVQSLPASGCIHPGTPEMLQLLPEEERAEEFIAVYTDFPLSLGENDGEVEILRAGPDPLERIGLADGKGTQLVCVWILSGVCGEDA